MPHQTTAADAASQATLNDARTTLARATAGAATAPTRGNGAGKAVPPEIRTSGEFVAGFVPPDYVVDGLLQQGFFYSLTGSTGAGKTSITLRLAASVALGLMFAGRETRKARVLYIAAENPDDVRMKWIGLAPHMDFQPGEIEVFFTDRRFTISKMMPVLRTELERLGGAGIIRAAAVRQRARQRAKHPRRIRATGVNCPPQRLTIC
jgi:hypothetical protein